MAHKAHTEISEIGKNALIKRLSTGSDYKNDITISGFGDDAAVIACLGAEYKLLANVMMLEGVDFDLVYFPLRHLGYKSAAAACDRILAMNGKPHQLTVSLGLSAKFSVEQVEELCAGVRTACSDMGADLVGINASASVNGLVISVSALGDVDSSRIAYRNGARVNDLICLTGDLGAAYMGLHLLEREKRAFEGHPAPQPDFKGREYLLRRQLQPYPRKDVVDSLAESGIIPTSMTALTDGLAAGLLAICESSDCGARIYLDRLPIARETYAMAEELHADPVVAAINGGDDYELLFTVPLAMRDKVESLGGIEIVGHITAPGTGEYLVTPDGSDIPITTP